MELSEETKGRVESVIKSDKIVLFMKGTRSQPMCGFSAATVGMLDTLADDYTTVNVLEDPELREGIKRYSNWPTIPQLYIDQEFIGGCDIVKQLFNTGALHETLGAAAPDRTPPAIELSEAAAALIRNALDGKPDLSVHLSIDSRWQHNFSLAPAEGHEVKAVVDGLEILLDVGSASRARGLRVDVTETLQGTGFDIHNPNAPAPVQQMGARTLKERLDAEEALHVFDVRGPDEREKASLAGARPLDERALEDIGKLPKDAPLVFFCHVGQRSQGAAEHFRLQGFTNVHNLSGGIDAWSLEVDPGVPRY